MQSSAARAAHPNRVFCKPSSGQFSFVTKEPSCTWDLLRTVSYASSRERVQRSLTFAIEGFFVVEVNHSRRHSHRLRAKKQIEKEIALEVIKQTAQQALCPEAGISVHKPIAGIWANSFEVVGDCMAGGP